MLMLNSVVQRWSVICVAYVPECPMPCEEVNRPPWQYQHPYCLPFYRMQNAIGANENLAHEN